MNDEVARYKFQSWLRKGLATQIRQVDVLGGAPPADERALVPVGVTLNGTPLTAKDFALIGPGDIIGVHRDMIVRTEPRLRIVDFEPNYLAFVEFYDEDFPWRYTPARPDGDRLRPWLSLVVLADGEFSRDDRRVPLPVVTVKREQALPDLSQSWMFAHVHSDDEIPDSELSSLEKYLKSLQTELTTDPDRLYSRLMSPRHLEPNTSYTAFLVPTFEAGRLAGLKLPVDGVPAQKAAWDGSSGLELPVYFDWSFTTGEEVDFESLVELLEPRVIDEKVGIRSMDCRTPGFVRVDDQGLLVPGGENGMSAPTPDIQGLEGALRSPYTTSSPENFTANAFQDELTTLLNLPDTVAADFGAPVADSSDDADFLLDPVVSLPFYGQNHARKHKTDKLPFDATNTGWVHDLNRDPRTRVPAAFGTTVIQKNQEKLMQRAWQQVQTVFEGNRLVRGAQFIAKVSARITGSFFDVLPETKLLAVTAALHAKVLGSPTTLRKQMRESRLRAPVLGATFRRLTRPGGRIARRLTAAGKSLDHAALIGAVNTGAANPAPPRELPQNLPSIDDIAAADSSSAQPDWLKWLIEHRLAAVLILFAILLLIALAIGGVAVWIACAGLAAVAVAVFRWVGQQGERASVAAALTDPETAIAAVTSAPAAPNFVPRVADGAPPLTPTPGPTAESDSVEAANFRLATVQLQRRLAARLPEVAPLAEFNLSNGAAKMKSAIDPRVSFARNLKGKLKLPDGVVAPPPAPGEEFVEAMAAPDFEDAMYAPLRDISKELLIPNLDLVPPNTIGILETNPKFIESYLVGLNHEMARELLWREYPTDMRGSYFRQFWEVKGISNPTSAADAEQLKDVTKLYTWPLASALGSHKPTPPADADVQPGEKQLVLVIRGELLKRYPNTVVYAQKAVMKNGELAIDTDDIDDPAVFKRTFKFPMFRAEIDPDLRFFGFDLTTDKALGTTASRDFPGDTYGWFFVIQEVPGEPRFGMDIEYEPTVDEGGQKADTWNNLAWDLFGAAEPEFVTVAPAPTFRSPLGANLSGRTWGASAADMAFILFQTPVMVAVHAGDMLKKKDV